MPASKMIQSESMVPWGTCEWCMFQATETYLGPHDTKCGAEGDCKCSEPREGEACACGEGHSDGGGT